MNTKETIDTSQGSARQRGGSVCSTVCSLLPHVTLLIRQTVRGEDYNTGHICASPLVAPAAASPLLSPFPSPPDAFQELRHAWRQWAQINSQVTGRRAEERRDETRRHNTAKWEEGPWRVQTMFGTTVPRKKRRRRKKLPLRFKCRWQFL